MIHIPIDRFCPIPCALRDRSTLHLPPGAWTEGLHRLTRVHVPVVNVRELRERRFPQGYCCPHCRGRRIHRHGRYRNRQRYRCLSCGRTFNDWTGTPLHGTHHPEKWPLFVVFEDAGQALTTTAAALGLSVSTVFAWRHRLLAALPHGAVVPALTGLLELDELYVLEAQKGSRHLAREPRARGTGRCISRWRWLEDGPRHGLLLAHDRQGRWVGEVFGPRSLTVHVLEAALATMGVEPTELCVDTRQAYWSYARRQGQTRHCLHHRSQEQRGLYHMRHVDRLETRLIRWIRRFRGISTRYLEHYLGWFVVLDRESRPGLAPGALARELLLEAIRPLV